MNQEPNSRRKTNHWKKDAEYLGIHIDRKLTYNKHIQGTTRAKAQIRR